MSKQKLNLLILEDNPDDAELIVRELEKEGFVLEWERVDTEIEFRKALAKNPEIILADYKLPSYNGMAAIKLQRKTAPDIPLIIVSGTIGEELAVECLKAGATDYVLKARLSRLSLAVKRALKEVEERNELKQAEEILRKSEEKYHLITESTSDVISLHTFDLDAVYTYVSPSVKTLSGYEPEELIGKSCFDFIHPEDKKILLPLLQKYIRSKIKSLITRKKISVKETFEYRIKDKSGKWSYAQSTGNIMGDQLLFVSRDITKNKQAEKALRESEEKYRNLVENIEEGIVSVDENENFIFVNNATSKIFGYSEKELLKKNLKDFTTPDEFKKIIEHTSIRKKGKSSKYEINIIKKDGNHAVISTTASPIFDDNKKYTGAFGIFQDITERKKAEEELRESEERFRRLFEDLGDAVFVTKIGEIDRGIIMEINPAAEKQTGYTRNELIGMNIIKYLSINESGELSYDEWDEKLNKGEMVTNVEKKRKKDGTEYWTEVIVTPINFKGEKASLSINHDITERKKAEEHLKKKNTELEAFNKLTIGRELKMIELKKEINELLTKLGQKERYKIVE